MTEPRDSASIAAKLAIARRYLASHPSEATSQDTAARARLVGGLRIDVDGPNGWHLETDMSTAVGGEGSAPSPGWLLRAALASCDAVLIAMQCAEEGVALSALEAEVTSESDDRGLLGMDDAPAGPLSMALTVRIDAEGLGRPELEAIVNRALQRSPVSDAVRREIPVEVRLA